MLTRAPTQSSWSCGRAWAFARPQLFVFAHRSDLWYLPVCFKNYRNDGATSPSRCPHRVEQVFARNGKASSSRPGQNVGQPQAAWRSETPLFVLACSRHSVGRACGRAGRLDHRTRARSASSSSGKLASRCRRRRPAIGELARIHHAFPRDRRHARLTHGVNRRQRRCDRRQEHGLEVNEAHTAYRRDGVELPGVTSAWRHQLTCVAENRFWRPSKRLAVRNRN